jgi:uncharacterized protein YqgQ
MIEFELQGLNARQRVLADIMWSLEEFEQVEAFIATLPDREACECQTIIEMMKMALVEQVAPEIKGHETYTEAEQVLRKYNTKKG